MNRLTLLMASMLSLCTTVMAHGAETINFDENWKFAFGNAADPAKDFGCGTEYFNYLTKAASIHNEGPYSPKFDPAKWDNEWKEVNLPHDWVVDLPFSPDASHSHGYKTVGYKYPETSVGWYRKVFSLPADDLGRHLSLRFDGIFRDARVWVNGFYLGSEPSGYASQVYDISEYLNYGGDNVIAVRADASLEEGWFYEGAGIYRHVWLEKTDPLHVAPFGTFVHSSLAYPYDTAEVTIETTVDNKGNTPASYELRHRLIAPDGSVAATASASETGLLAKESRRSISGVTVSKPVLWDVDAPHLYKLITEVVKDGSVVDRDTVVTGIRDARFDPDKGFLLNNRPLKLKGVNMHQDHAGVGAAIPDALQAYRLRELKKFGVNAYRSSHNPMTPEMLDACDSLGILVLEENRLSGINDEHVRLLKRMIERDRNHPSIIAWSVGNEEWGIEWNEFGNRISESMREYCHRFDPTRPMCFATSGGPTVVVPADVAGYNYIMQNPVEQHRRDYPSRIALGSEETTGCGTRGIYFDDRDNGRMASLNRSPNGSDSILNCIGRGWRFYADRPWLAGLFYWTGFDYRGEPNPLKFPATGSEFGILDYCGFPKDEAFYLKSWWTGEPVLHILPHWNLNGHEGEPVQIWVYSNMDEVELAVNGKSLGRKTMPRNGHLAWDAVYQPGKVTATGYKNGKKAMTAKVETSGAPAKINAAADRQLIKADNHDVAVVNITLSDSKKRFVPDGCVTLDLTVDGPVRILGVGNGDPAWQDAERPADPMSRTFKVKTFNGMAQVILQAAGNEAATATLAVSSEGLQPATVSVDVR